MDYFRNYESCKQVYNIYNKRLKCAEYLEYVVQKNLLFYYLDDYHTYHNIKGPAYIENYNNDGSKSGESYYINGLRHNSNGPAYIQYFEDGSKLCETYYINGRQHNSNGPAYLEYNDGEITSEEYLINDKRHNENGPAVIHYENNKVWCEEYWINGRYHNIKGPAIINYYDNGNIKQEVYYLYGKKLSKKKFILCTNEDI